MQLRALRGWILAVSWTLAVSTAAPRAAEAAGPADPMPEVLISGERPVPGMWRVSNANPTLWILATLVPLPRQMTWRSHEVGTRIASSRVVPAPPEIMAESEFLAIGSISGFCPAPRKFESQETLKQVFPPDLHNRWLTVSPLYTSRSYDDHWRPILAARHLFQGALEKRFLIYSRPQRGVRNAAEVGCQLRYGVSRTRAIMRQSG
jgi:hypothetical protein